MLRPRPVLASQPTGEGAARTFRRPGVWTLDTQILAAADRTAMSTAAPPPAELASVLLVELDLAA